MKEAYFTYYPATGRIVPGWQEATTGAKARGTSPQRQYRRLRKLGRGLLYVLATLGFALLLGFAALGWLEEGWGQALAADEKWSTDYAAVMQDCALRGELTAGRDAARRRDEKIDALGLDYPKVNFDELFLLSRIITAEAGSDWLPREWKMSVGEVVLNRVASTEFPDSVEEVIYQDHPLQYYSRNDRYFRDLLPYESCIKAAWNLLSGERVLCDPSVVFQANFPQGSGTAVKYYDRRLGSTYFCYSAKLWLYEEAQP